MTSVHREIEIYVFCVSYRRSEVIFVQHQQLQDTCINVEICMNGSQRIIIPQYGV